MALANVAEGDPHVAAHNAERAAINLAMTKAANLSDVASAATARTNLGLDNVAASGSAADLGGLLAAPQLTPGAAVVCTWSGTAWVVPSTRTDLTRIFVTSDPTATVPTGLTTHDIYIHPAA